MSPDLAIPASPAALRNEGSGSLPLTAKAASFSGIGYARRNGVTLCMGQYQGGFALCTVMSGEFLDEDFQRVNPYEVEGDTTAYFRYVDNGSGVPTPAVTLESRDEDDPTVVASIEMPIHRLGKASVYLSDPFTLRPGVASAPGARSTAALMAGNSVLTVFSRISDLFGLFGTKEAGRSLAIVPWKLKIEFLDDEGRPESSSGSAVVRFDRKPDQPPDAGHTLYTEKTWIRIVATLPGTDVIDTTASGFAMLTEQKNRDLELGRQLSYRGEKNKTATLLTVFEDPQASGADADWTRVPITSGVSSPIGLWSLAGPRMDFNSTIQKPTWLATLVARPTTQNLPRSFRDSAAAPVPQWSDQGSCGLTGGATQSTFTSGAINYLPDWLEAHAWDVIARMRQGTDPSATPFATQVGAAVLDVRAPESGCSANWYAYVCEQIIHYDTRKFSTDALRFDGPNDAIYHGMRAQGAHFLTENVQHEARHCWQHAQTEADADGDGLPEFILDSAEELRVPSLLDSQNVFRSGGKNPEFDFRGPAQRDDQTNDQKAVRSDAVERDAMRWEARNAGSVVTSGLKCISPNLVTSASTTIPVYDLGATATGSTVGFSLVARATGLSYNRILGYSTDRVSGILMRVKRETDSVPGETEAGSPDGRVTDPVTNTAALETVGLTGNNGSALFYITPGPGLNIFSVTVRHPDVQGHGAGQLAAACDVSTPSPLYFKIRGN